MKRILRLHVVGACVVTSIGSLSAAKAIAQVPPHAPGTVCYTPLGYCAAQPPGAAGHSMRLSQFQGTNRGRKRMSIPP